VFDGAMAYGVDNATAGSYVLRIDTSTNTLTATQARDVTATAISLVGVTLTSNNLVYLVNDRSAIKSVLKSNLTQTTTLKALTATQSIDPLIGFSGAPPSAPPVAFLVGDAVYFTVADTSGTLPSRPFTCSSTAAACRQPAAAVGSRPVSVPCSVWLRPRRSRPPGRSPPTVRWC